MLLLLLPTTGQAHLLDEGKTFQLAELSLTTNGVHVAYTLVFDEKTTANFLINIDENKDGKVSDAEFEAMQERFMKDQPVFVVVRTGSLKKYYQDFRPLKSEKTKTFDQNKDGSLDDDEIYEMLMSSPIEQYNVFRKDVSLGTFESQPTRYKLTVDLQTKEKKQYARFQLVADYPVPTKELTTIQLEIEFKHILSCSDFRITKTPEGLVESSTLNKEAEEWALDDPAKIFQRFDALPKIRRLFMRCRLPEKSPKEPGTE